MKARIFLSAAIAALAFSASQAAIAQDESPAPSIVALYWTAVSAYWQPNAADAFAAFGLRGGVALDGRVLGESAGGGIGLRLALEAYSNFAGVADTASWVFSQPDPMSLVASGNGRLKGALDMKEAWIDFALGDADLRVGKQLFSWGLADGNNPTDNLNARHVGTRLVSTLDEQKMGALAANVVYNLPGNLGSVQGVFLPISVASDVPSMAMDMTVVAPPTTQRVVLYEDKAPDISFENMEGGLRALLYAGNLSFSASWLSYLDRYPDYKVINSGSFPNFTTTLTPFHGRVNQFGLDAAWLTGGFDLRTEWAFTLTGDTNGKDPAVRNSSLSGVVQATRSFLDGALSTSLAWAPRLVIGHMRPSGYATQGDRYLADMLAGYNGQAYAFEQMGSVRIAGKLLNETVQPEALFLASLEARDFLATASLAYNLADGLNLKAGGGYYGSFRSAGDPEREWGLFSNLRTIDQSYLFVELRLSL